MVGNHAFTYNGQTAAQRRTSTSRSSEVSDSPSRHTGALVPTRSIAQGSQQLPDCDLFTTLLFDRRRAYQSISSASSGLRAISASTPTESSSLIRPTSALNLELNINVHSTRKQTLKNDDTGMLGFRNIPKAPATSRKRERPKETKTQMVTVKHQKRKTPLRVSPRLAKRQMTEANSKKKVDNKGGTMDKRRNNALSNAFIISSDDDEEEKEEGPALPCADPDVEEDAKPIFANAEPIPKITERIPGRIETISRPDTEEFSDGLLESDFCSKLTQDNPQQKLERMQTEHAQEMQRLRQELDAARTEIESIQQLQATAAKDQELEHVQATNLAESKYAITLRDLENERKEVVQLTRANERLHLQIDNTKAECDTLSSELADVRAARSKEKKEHEDILEEVAKAKAADTTSATNNLLSENQRLHAENERLKTAVKAAPAAASQSSTTPTTPLPSQTPLYPISPYPIFPTPPSSQQTHVPISPAFSPVFSHVTKTKTESPKEDNIRKVYTKTKRRFDSLHSVAMQLVHCTRTIDLIAWGEFGRCLGKLREILNEDEKERARKGGSE